MAKIYYETPEKGLSYCTLGAQILSIILAIFTLLFSTHVIPVEEFIRNIFWWIAFAFLAIGVILEYISNLKKKGSSRIIAYASLGGIVAALLLVISTFLRFLVH